MRWLVIKDLQLLRRSPLITALLVIYPIVISVLIGFAISGGPDKPRVAFLNLVPEGSPFRIGGAAFDLVNARGELCERIECVRVATREEAREKVESGETLAALIIPADIIERLRSLAGLNPEQPTVEVLVNEEDPVKSQFVDDRISALIAEANLQLSNAVTQVGVGYLNTLIEGGNFSLFGEGFEVLGMERTVDLLAGIRNSLEPGSPAGPALDQVIRFAELARDNLDVADDLIGAIATPIAAEKEIVSGSAPTLETFAVAVALAFTLMFVTVLLVAGSLAAEREEGTYARLTRGLVGRGGLIGSKLALGVFCSTVVTALMLIGLEMFTALEWERAGLWLAAILAGSLAFAAFGVAIGALAAEVRAASLIAFMVSLPVAFLSLVPTGTVSKPVFDAIGVFTGAFPFDAALRALESALEAGGPDLGLALVHLGALALAWSLVGALALRRLADSR